MERENLTDPDAEIGEIDEEPRRESESEEAGPEDER
jgi:hypothetical protein